MKYTNFKYKLNFKTMKKGFLTLLAASVLFVGCQNYEDPVDDVNAQISALKSQVDGLASLSGQVASLSGSISGLQAGVTAAQAAASSASSAASSIDLTGLSTSLATLQAEVDAVQASLATTATASAVATLQAEIDAIEADVDELLATSNVYNQNLTISSASTLDAAVALGSNINIVNGSVTITQSSTMDATKLQTVIDKIFTVTGNFSYTAANTNVTAMTFNKLASAGDVTLKVNGPISASALVTAGTLTLDDSYISKVTSINLDALTTVTEIQTDSGGTDNIVFTSATDVQLGALASYPGAGSDYGLTITTKADATLDIGSLDDVKTDGTAAPVALALNGPKDVTISNMTAYAGSLSLTNVENATITGFKGPITVNGGVENITMTDVEDFAFSSATALKTVTLDVDKASDPALTATQTAPSAYGAAVTGYTSPTPALAFASMANLTSVTLTGFYQSLSFTSLANLASLDIDVTTGDLTITDNDNLTTLDVTGSEIGNVTVTNNDGIATVDLDHTTDLNFYGTTADRKSVAMTVTGNSEMTLFHNTGATNIMTFNLSSNAKLATVKLTGMTGIGTATTTSNPVVDVYSNALVASSASDTDDGLTQYSIDGTNDASDLGSFTTTSGMETIKTYLTAVNLNAKSDANVHFDTVQLHNIAADAATSSETAGDQNSGNAVSYSSEGNNDVTLVYSNTASTLTTTTSGDNAAVKQKTAWLIDVSSVSTLALKLGSAGNTAGVDILETDGTFGTLTLTGNNTLDVAELTSAASTSRATTVGVTLTAAATGNPVLPTIQFMTSVSSAEGSNGEAYTNTEASDLSYTTTYAGAAVPSYLTTYDVFTLSYGGNSVTATLAANAITGAIAAANIASTLMDAWNTKYSTGSTSGALSAWTTGALSTALITAPTLRDSRSGGRFFTDTAAVTWTPATAAQASLATSGVITQTVMSWTIGSTDATTDNGATGTDIILAIEETVAGNGMANRLTGHASLIGDGTAIGTVENNLSNSFGLVTNLISVGSSAVNTGTTTNIFPSDARGDVVVGVTANAGTTATTGTARTTYTRLHWLG
jgi:filamentous hemagglutinin